ncbi:Photosystem I assembly protein Ycf3 [Caballeronia sp. SBC1]|uniref:tetratricopeptide repeat protein n=1 Tax=unclassified Caballeronia TaxID=2646786 RepID=UPI0013E15362|nr:MULTISPECIES: tetratricopeptide repeat protein [unclassified Caballeronia]QIE22006.1 Photosystem I assembly protein Ycf3 [Caballeronia sp. SBC2]QIN60041.1 Photosystem I assembly protein Ycf3 [Caballeronia sp. SBC1]
MNQLAEPLAVALDLHQAGHMAEAESGYRAILKEHPDHVDALHYLGVLLHQRGDNEGAAKWLDRALGLAPHGSACWSNRGLVAAALGDLPHAVECYERALAIDPAFANARNNLGTALQKQGRFDESIEQLQTLLAQDPDFIDARLNLGSTLASAKRYDEALAAYRETLARDPSNFHAHFGEGNALRELKRFDESVASLRRALALKPDHFEANVNLGTTLGLCGKFVEAEAQYRRALTLRDDPQIHVCVGATIGSQGRFEEEEPYYRHALTLAPDHADALHNLALLQLRRGNFKEGWALHEVRWRSSKYKPMSVPGVPEWRGESLKGKTLLVAGEQGHGDMMQFARYVTMLEKMGATVDMWVPENIVELIQSVPGMHTALHLGPTHGYDFWVPSMSVPHHLAERVPAVLADIPYMSVSAERIGSWPERVKKLAGTRRKIGIVWAGSPTFGNDQFRSMPFAAWSPFAEVANTEWFSLQKGAARDQLSQPGCALRPHDLTDDIHDFADTAALIEQLDLVITVDTSVAHLAGALGKPVWVFLPANYDWRWMLDRDDSPWYPRTRLFKQTTLGDWTEPVARAKAALMAG